MRHIKFVSLLMTLALALGISLVGVSPASAKEAHNVRYIKAGEIRDSGKFYAKGAVKTYRGKKVKLQRARRGSGNYRTIKRDRTNRKGRFYMRFDGPRGSCYRVVIPGTRRYKQYTQRVGCIVSGRSADGVADQLIG